METPELDYEPSLLPDPKSFKKERPYGKEKKIRFALKKVSKELKKKEAEKPLYLARV